jgi:hypothetical protein
MPARALPDYTANDFRLMDVGTGTTRLFDVRGDGLTTVSSGGMAVLSGGVTVSGGLTVSVHLA